MKYREMGEGIEKCRMVGSKLWKQENPDKTTKSHDNTHHNLTMATPKFELGIVYL